MNKRYNQELSEALELPIIFFSRQSIADTSGLSQDEDLRPFIAGSIRASILGPHALTGPYKGYGRYSTGQYVGSLKDGRAIVATVSKPDLHLQYIVQSVSLT